MQLNPNYEYKYCCETCGISALSNMTLLQMKLHKRKFPDHEIVLEIK